MVKDYYKEQGYVAEKLRDCIRERGDTKVSFANTLLAALWSKAFL